MTRIEFWSAVMGLLVATVLMFNQMTQNTLGFLMEDKCSCELQSS